MTDDIRERVWPAFWEEYLEDGENFAELNVVGCRTDRADKMIDVVNSRGRLRTVGGASVEDLAGEFKRAVSALGPGTPHMGASATWMGYTVWLLIDASSLASDRLDVTVLYRDDVPLLNRGGPTETNMNRFEGFLALGIGLCTESDAWGLVIHSESAFQSNEPARWTSGIVVKPTPRPSRKC